MFKGFSIASMVLGILSLLLLLLTIPGTAFLAETCSILSIIFYGVCKSNGYKSGMAVAGLVTSIVQLSIIAIVLSIGLSLGL